MITLDGEPKSTQHIYVYTCKGGYARSYMSAEGEAIKEAYGWEAKRQWANTPLSGPIEIWLYFYFGTKRRHDIDNFNKLVLDAMTGIVYEDDSQIKQMHLYNYYDKNHPRIEVKILPL